MEGNGKSHYLLINEIMESLNVNYDSTDHGIWKPGSGRGIRKA